MAHQCKILEAKTNDPISMIRTQWRGEIAPVPCKQTNQKKNEKKNIDKLPFSHLLSKAFLVSLRFGRLKAASISEWLSVPQCSVSSSPPCALPSLADALGLPLIRLHCTSFCQIGSWETLTVNRELEGSKTIYHHWIPSSLEGGGGYRLWISLPSMGLGCVCKACLVLRSACLLSPSGLGTAMASHSLMFLHASQIFSVMLTLW